MKRLKIFIKRLLPSGVLNALIGFYKILLSWRRVFYKLLLQLCSWNIINPISGIFLTALGLEVRNFTSLNRFLQNNRQQSKVIEQITINYYYGTPVYYDEKYNYGKKYKLKIDRNHLGLIALLRNAHIAGNSNIINTVNENAIYDLKYFDSNDNFLYTDGEIISYNNKFCLLKTRSCMLKLEQGIKLTANYSWNYYHYVFEVLTKFFYLHQADVDKDVPLIVDSVVSEVAQFKELMNFCNKEGRKIIWLKKTEKCAVNNLIVLPEALIIPPNYLNVEKILAQDCKYDLCALSYLRESLLHVKSERKFPKRIFISRSNASKRRKYNEVEIFDLLASYGFVKTYPETLTVADQISLFNGAENIVGASGAAFSNVLFCNSRCKVLCLTNFKLQISLFSTIAAFVRVDFAYIHDKKLELSKKSYLHERFVININDLIVVLEDVWKLKKEVR